ncbi:hypothetical protein PG994_012055 [Apiospora phragmitis]|uniref:F-box domain-containing protein n=1 Tax=Apiospora phragmitis TaxID=2905665 RepID=A0ABR1TUL5_9PEZI
MDRVPAEIKLAIAQLVVQESPTSACACATVSRQWQALFEPATFSSLRLNQVRLPQAETILTPLRQTYVRQIHFMALLPGYETHKEFEIEPEKKENDLAFSDAVARLVGCLHSWSLPHKLYETSQRGIELGISAVSTTNLQDMKAGLTRVRPDELPHYYDRKERCATSYVALREEGLYPQLPEVSFINKFICPSVRPFSRQPVPKTCCEIANRFPNLNPIDWNLGDGSHDHAFRVQLRNNFATDLSLLPKSVRQFTLCYDYGPGLRGNIADRNPRLCPGAVLDPLCIALRRLSMQLETISLDMVIGSKLLWEPEFDQNQEEVHWPRLRKMRLRFPGRIPQGTHFLDWDPEGPIWDMDLDGSFTADRVLAHQNPIHLALVRAAGRMPKLKVIYATWRDRYCLSVEFLLQPGRPDGIGSRAEFRYEGSPLLLDLPHALQEAWSQTARMHLREGAEFTKSLLRFRTNFPA